jgi:hypothetical protein
MLIPAPLPNSLFEKATRLRVVELFLEFLVGENEENILNVGAYKEGGYPSEGPEALALFEEVKEWADAVYEVEGLHTTFAEAVIYDFRTKKVLVEEWPYDGGACVQHVFEDERFFEGCGIRGRA